MTNELVVQQTSFDISNDVEVMQKLCSNLMKTKHFAKLGEEGVFSILCKAKSMGINPMDALNGAFYFVSGKMGMSSEMMASLIRKAGHSIIKDKASTDTCCILHGKRADNGDTWTIKFSIDDAKRAGIYKNMWEKYPTSMTYNRALSFLARQLFPDVIQGVSYNKDELDEIAENKRPPKSNPTMTLTDYEEVNHIETIAEEQALELKTILGECSAEYKKQVWETLKSMNPPVKDLLDLPSVCFQSLHKAALFNRMENQAALAKSDSEEQEKLAVKE